MGPKMERLFIYIYAIDCSVLLPFFVYKIF